MPVLSTIPAWYVGVNSHLSAAINQNPTQVSAGWYHSCVLDDNGVSCWG